jgi:hypothetical protein
MAKEIMDAFNTYKNGADLQFMVDECLIIFPCHSHHRQQHPEKDGGKGIKKQNLPSYPLTQV